MTIRIRLAIAMALLIALTVALLSVFIVRTTRATLTDQLDDSLVASSQKIANQPDHSKDPTNLVAGVAQNDVNPTAADDDGWQKNTYAVIRYNATGSVISSQPSGYVDDPDSLPAVPNLASSNAQQLIANKQIVTVPSVDGTMKYRLEVCPTKDGDILAVAMPLNEVDDAVDRILKLTLGGGAFAILLAAGTSWWIIRNRLKPVDRMIDTAAAIGAGNLSLRAPDANPRTELGKLSGALNNMLTQIEQSVDARVESEQRLRRFVADAAHELRTPLTSLRGYTELHRAGALANDDAIANAMRRIDSESQRMQRLVEDLLLLARLDQERGDERVPVDIVSIVDEAIDAAQTIDPQRPFLRRLPARAVVMGDPVRLRQIFDNLLTNARIHTPGGTEVAVSADIADGAVTLHVADRGPGIPHEDQEKVFERFWRADPSRARATGGSGLGLAIVASLVRSNEGTISLGSTPGEGTNFSIRFPLAEPESETAPGVTSEPDYRSPHRMRRRTTAAAPNPASGAD